MKLNQISNKDGEKDKHTATIVAKLSSAKTMSEALWKSKDRGGKNYEDLAIIIRVKKTLHLTN